MEENTTQGYIYIITANELESVKIGFSIKPEERLKTLQTSSPYKLEIAKLYAGTVKQEKAVHRHLKKRRLEGEWFDCAVWEAEVAIGQVLNKPEPVRLEDISIQRISDADLDCNHDSQSEEAKRIATTVVNKTVSCLLKSIRKGHLVKKTILRQQSQIIAHLRTGFFLENATDRALAETNWPATKTAIREYKEDQNNEAKTDINTIRNVNTACVVSSLGDVAAIFEKVLAKLEASYNELSGTNKRAIVPLRRLVTDPTNIGKLSVAKSYLEDTPISEHLEAAYSFLVKNVNQLDHLEKEFWVGGTTHA